MKYEEMNEKIEIYDSGNSELKFLLNFVAWDKKLFYFLAFSESFQESQFCLYFFYCNVNFYKKKKKWNEMALYN